MKNILKTSPKFTILVLFLLLVPTTYAQFNLTLSGEGGNAQNSFGNGSSDSTPVYGASIGAIIFGSTSKRIAFQVPVYGELKTAKVPFDSYTDLIAGADLAIRYRNFSFGPGGNYGYIARGEVKDSTCLAQPVRVDSSCDSNGNGANNGMRDIGEINLLGFGGFGKYNFGPEGRAFIQGRYTHYDKNLGYLMNRSDTLARSSFDLSAFNLPEIPDIADYPAFDGGRDIRVTFGYVFGGGKFLRGQYVDRQLNFTPTLGNLSGVFNQRSRTFTFGGGVVLR
jgi:hypothetical protein